MDISNDNLVSSICQSIYANQFCESKPTQIKALTNETKSTDNFPELDSVLETLNKPEDRVFTKLYTCNDCKVEMDYMQIEGSMCYICPKCGMIEEIIGDDSDASSQTAYTSYNTLLNASIPIKMTGQKCNAYQKRVTSSTAEYIHTQRRVTHDQMTKLTCHVEQARVPSHIVDQAANDYHKFQQFYVKRGDVRKGIMAWLVYEICTNSGLDRTPKEISQMFEISQSELSEGSKIVKNARVSGQLENNMKSYNEDDQMKSKMTRYFAILEIPDIYWDFVQKLITFVYKKRHKSKHSGMKARCAGAIYILSLSVPDLKITRNIIAEKCNISQATFIRFANIVFDIIKLDESDKTRRQLKHIYKKYEIPFTEA